MEKLDEQDEILARFMGYHISASGRTLRKGGKKGSLGSPYRIRDVHFRSSWDWLMPVVEKINKLEGLHFIIYSGVAQIVDMRCCTVTKSSVTEKRPEIIKAVYEAAVNFIGWYNKQHGK